MSDRNIQTLEQISIYMQVASGPFVVFGDFQISPNDLFGTGWPHRNKLQLALPWGLTATCALSNGQASLIDYFLVSPHLNPSVVDHDFPPLTIVYVYWWGSRNSVAALLANNKQVTTTDGCPNRVMFGWLLNVPLLIKFTRSLVHKQSV